MQLSYEDSTHSYGVSVKIGGRLVAPFKSKLRVLQKLTFTHDVPSFW